MSLPREIKEKITTEYFEPVRRALPLSGEDASSKLIDTIHHCQSIATSIEIFGNTRAKYAPFLSAEQRGCPFKRLGRLYLDAYLDDKDKTFPNQTAAAIQMFVREFAFNMIALRSFSFMTPTSFMSEHATDLAAIRARAKALSFFAPAPDSRVYYTLGSDIMIRPYRGFFNFEPKIPLKPDVSTDEIALSFIREERDKALLFTSLYAAIEYAYFMNVSDRNVHSDKNTHLPSIWAVKCNIPAAQLWMYVDTCVLNKRFCSDAFNENQRSAEVSYAMVSCDTITPITGALIYPLNDFGKYKVFNSATAFDIQRLQLTTSEPSLADNVYENVVSLFGNI